jgi:DNA-binding transcriptional MerR regulator
VSSRTYLSIGDVLALLRQEFPDVTISKIRFLESQGLVNPERTPSGYRKFYEHDVERLRWVLRQQREHFLPLKVIKGRLEQEGADVGEDDGYEVAVGTAGVERGEPGLVGRASVPLEPRSAGSELPGFESPVAEPPRAGADPRRGRAGPSARPDLTRPRGAAVAPAPVPGVARGTGPAGHGSSTGTLASGAGRGGGAQGPGPGGARSTMRSTGAGSGAAGPGPAKRSGTTAPVREVAPGIGMGVGVGDEEPAPPTMPDDAVTLEELIEASGLDVAAVEQLESYGLLCGRVVGGVVYYDEDALTVARVAAGLARYGVEARHLRVHKLAAEREAGFIEQVVLPLLKQRNPEARQRAFETVAELTVLGQDLREVLLRSALREQLGG